MSEAKKKVPKIGAQEPRSINGEINIISEDEGILELSFASEILLSRWYGVEVLQHDAGSIDYTRLREMGVLLFNHNRNIVLGKISEVWLDESNRKSRAKVQFDMEDPEAVKIYNKVRQGILKGTSVSYNVDVWEEVAAGKISSSGRIQGPAYVAVKWEPTEVTIASVPADPTVGVGRSAESSSIENNNEEEDNMGEENQQRSLIPPTVDVEMERQAAIQAERQRVAEISALCRDFNMEPGDYIQSGIPVDQVRTQILEKLRTDWKPSTAPAARVTEDETDKFREAASDALLMRAGTRIEKPFDGARDLRGMKLRDVAIECLVRAGYSNPHRLSEEDLLREALSPNSQFASILSDSVNKSVSTAYSAAQTTYQAWTGRGSNPDFKKATHYQISEAGELVEMTQSGEFKFDEMNDQGVDKAVATFGRSWGFTRKAMIDDDLSILTKVPERYVRASSRGINKLVYQMLGTNPTIYDGKKLFIADHRNLAAVGAVIGTGAIGDARTAMRKQKNLRGKETLNIPPTFLIVPASLETDAQKFLMSTADPEGINSGVANIFRNSLSLVVDAELDEYSETAYYLAASPSDVDTIEVTYLNGRDMPTVESQVGFDFLGIKWRIFIDYGVTALDYRGLYKNPGAAPQQG